MDAQNDDAVGFDLNALSSMLSEGVKTGGAALQKKLDEDAAKKLSDDRYNEAVKADEAATDARAAAMFADRIAKASGTEADKVKLEAVKAVAAIADEEQNRVGFDLPADAKKRRTAEATRRATLATKAAAVAATKAQAAPADGALKTQAQLAADKAKAAQETLVKARAGGTLDPAKLAAIQAAALAEGQSTFPWMPVAVGVGAAGLLGTVLYLILRRKG